MRRRIYISLVVILGLAAFLFFKKAPPAVSSPNSSAIANPIADGPPSSQNSAASSEIQATPSPPVAAKTSDSSVQQVAVAKDAKNFEEPRHLTPAEVAELRSQTRSFLSTVYTAQLAFHAEYDQFVTDIDAMEINRNPKLPFKAGFLEPSESLSEIPAEAKVDSQRLSTDFVIGEKASENEEGYHYGPFVRDIDLSAYRQYCQQGCTANKDHFEILLATPLGNPDQVDVWLLNDRKELTLVKDGTKPQNE